MSNLMDSISNWENFYREIGIEVDFPILRIPTPRISSACNQLSFNYLMSMAKGLMPQLLYYKCKELFPCRKWTKKNLDKIIKSERTAKNGNYAIWIRNRIEADKELSFFSANDLEKRNVLSMTLEERFVFELKCFKATNIHLDIESATICAGSRLPNGGVPIVGWCDGMLVIDWEYDGFCDRYFRARRVIV